MERPASPARSSTGRRASLAVLGAALAAFAAPAGCAGADERVHADVIADLTLPRGVLDKAERLELRVREGDITCDAATGAVTVPKGDVAVRDVLEKNLDQHGCADGARFCGTLTIPKSTKARVFHARALAGANMIATGCATATLDRDAVSVPITMFRYIAPSVCGDGILQPREQCEPPGGDVCDSSCQSREIVVSVGAASNGTTTGAAGDKLDPFFVWPSGAGDAGRFVAVFTDRAVPTGGDATDVGLRVLGDTLAPVTTPPSLAAGSIFLATGSTFPPPATAGDQALPQAAALGGKYYVAFQENLAGSQEVRLQALTSSFTAEGGTGPVTVNGSSGEDGAQVAPTLAAGKDKLFVAWQDDVTGSIFGRSVSANLTLGPQYQVSGGGGSVRPQIAFTSKGWVVVWSTSTGIKLRALDANGTPSGGEQTVNDGGGAAEDARVAALPDGRFAVTWMKDNDIFVQRYDDRGVPIEGDQARSVNDLVKEGDQTQPTIAATPGAGGSYVVAWRDARSGHIRARFLGGSSGFLNNNVDAQPSEFQASRVESHDRARPFAVAGGSGPYVAIGWEDRSADAPGIVVRRFPLPSE